MDIANSAQNTPPVELQVSGDNEAAQEKRALTNQGDTVRASWPFSLDSLRANIAYMSPAAKDLLIWAFSWCIDSAHPVNRNDFSDRVGYSANAIWKLYAGRYKHAETGKLLDAPEKLLKNIREFRRLELARAKMGAEKFAMGPTAKRIYWAIEQARKSRRPVMIYGGSQIGKTATCKRNCIDFNHGKTTLVEIEAVNGLRGLVQVTADKVGISPNGNTPDLIARLKDAITPDMVIIFDEIHLLSNVYRKGSFFACMEQLRRLWDHCKFGMVFTFTELGYDKVAEERKRELIQIFRRSVVKVNLGPSPLVGDVKAITEIYGLPWADRHEEIVVSAKQKIIDTPWAILKQLAAEEGVTSIVERIRIGNEMAADDNRASGSWTDFLKAHYALIKQSKAPKTGWEANGTDDEE